MTWFDLYSFYQNHKQNFYQSDFINCKDLKKQKKLQPKYDYIVNN